jgi:hypothetical protein
MSDEPKTVLPLQAVEEMLDDPVMKRLLEERDEAAEILREAACGKEQAPDWVLAGLACKVPELVVPFCVHTYLMDWREK